MSLFGLSHDQRSSHEDTHLLELIKFTLLEQHKVLREIRDAIKHQTEEIKHLAKKNEKTSVGYDERIGDGEENYNRMGNKVEISQSQSKTSRGAPPPAPKRTKQNS